MKTKKTQAQNSASVGAAISAQSLNDKLQNNENIIDAIKPWRPTFKQLGILSGSILIFLIAVFFIGNLFLKPFMVEPPKAITPWLDTKKETPPFTPAFDSNNSLIENSAKQ